MADVGIIWQIYGAFYIMNKMMNSKKMYNNEQLGAAHSQCPIENPWHQISGMISVMSVTLIAISLDGTNWLYINE